MNNLEMIYSLSMFLVVLVLIVNKIFSDKRNSVSKESVSFNPYIPRHLQKQVKTLTQSDIINRRF